MKGYFLLPIAALILTACGGQKQSDGSKATNQEVITDAICMDAKGNVASMEVTTTSGLFESVYTYKFNEQGELISIEDGQHVDLKDDDIKIERDDRKRPVKMTTPYYEEMDDEEPQYNVITFVYDDSGNLIKEQHGDASESWSITYGLDKDGRVTEYTMTVPEGDLKASISYPEDAIDEEGNWTSRTLTSGDETTTVTRKIEYRK